MKTQPIQIPTSFEEFQGKNLQYQFTKDTVNIFPKHHSVRNWVFAHKIDPNAEDNREEIEVTLEANLADAMARVAEIYGVSVNQLQHLFPAVLRMLKSNSQWTK